MEYVKNVIKIMISSIYRKNSFIAFLFLLVLLSACGTSEAQLAATKTKIAADIAAGAVSTGNRCATILLASLAAMWMAAMPGS